MQWKREEGGGRGEGAGIRVMCDAGRVWGVGAGICVMCDAGRVWGGAGLVPGVARA